MYEINIYRGDGGVDRAVKRAVWCEIYNILMYDDIWEEEILVIRTCENFR